MLFAKKSQAPQQIQEDNPSIAQWLEEEGLETEGQLALDVYQTDKKIVIKSTIAGVKPEDLKISLHNDLLSIRGQRQAGSEAGDGDYLFRECYWGAFSRSVILPAEVDSKRVEAELENGVLTITLYKMECGKIEIKVKD